MTTMSAGQRTRTRRITFLVALAVFAQESTWNFYESQVPPLLREHLASAAVVGLLMGMDNLLGIFIQPWIGNRSDRTRTSWGRRMPYLVVGMPIAAALFILIPHSAASLPLLIAVMFSYALVANTFKPIAEALVPDFIAPERRSRANAAVKIASSITAIVAALISIFLIDNHLSLAFAIPAIIMLISIGVLAATVRDSRSPAYQAAVAESDVKHSAERCEPRVRDTFVEILKDSDRSRLLLLVAILLFGSAWAASRSLITPYGMEVLDMSKGPPAVSPCPAVSPSSSRPTRRPCSPSATDGSGSWPWACRSSPVPWCWGRSSRPRWGPPWLCASRRPAPPASW